MWMQEIEKVKVLQSEREALKLRTKGKETEKKAENHTETVCPECGGRQLVHDYERAELVCQGCGLVIDDDFIDRGPEWRAFDHDQRMKRSRVGAPMTFTIHDKGLSTMIDWRNRDSYGSDASGSVMQPSVTLHSPFQNLIVWHLHSVFREMCVKLQLLFTVMQLIRT
jgi:ribosomal protein S27E